MSFDIENFSKIFNKTIGKRLSEIPAEDVKLINQEIENYFTSVTSDCSEEETKTLLKVCDQSQLFAISSGLRNLKKIANIE